MSAQENTTDSVKVTNDDNNVVIHSDFDKNLTSSKSEDILTTSGDSNDDKVDNLGSSDSNDVLTAGKLADLNNLVKNGGNITLSQDYTYQSETSYKTGVKISIAGTIINGNGFTLNGASTARIFEVTADNVIINNVK